MKENNKPPIINSLSDVVNMFFDENGCCNVSNKIPYIVILFLRLIAPDDYKIIICTSNDDLSDDGSYLVNNGNIRENIDNLHNIFRKKHILKTPGKPDKSFTTSLHNYRGENSKYSYYLINLCMDLTSIEYIPYEKMTEIIKLFTGIKLTRQNLFYIIDSNFNHYASECMNEISEQFKKLEISPGEAVHYDEEFLWINHQPHVRLTLIDALNRVVIADHVIPRDMFDRNYIKLFLSTSLDGLDIKYIITDGDTRYPKIITELGYIQQRCTFHIMKNLMDSLSQRHNSLRRKIKNLDEQIIKNENKLNELQAQNAGKPGRSKKGDKKREKNIGDKKKLKSKISQLKAKKRKYKKILKDDKKYIKRISLIFKSKTHKTAINRFNRLYEIKDQMSTEIKEFLENLKDHLEDALKHTLNKNLPSTNNLIEQFFKITFARKIKKIFRTTRGAMKRMKLNEIRWTRRNVIKPKLSASVI